MRAKFALIFLGLFLFPFLTGQSYSAQATEKALFIDSPMLAAKIRLDLIAEAQDEILVSTHIFKEDIVGLKLLSALQEAAKRGVKVRLIVDAFGDGITPDMKAALSSKEFEIYRFRPLNFKWLQNFNKRLHDKLFIVDQKKMVLGDRNVKDEYYRISKRSFVSHEVYVEGPSVKNAANYFNSLTENKALDQFRPVTEITDEMANKAVLLRRQVNRGKTISFSDASDWRNELREVDSMQFLHGEVQMQGKPSNIANDILKFIGRQKKSLILQNPYIDLTPDFKKAIRAAAARGVKISVITNAPLANDVKMIGALWEKNRSFFKEIGANVWELTGDTPIDKRPFRKFELKSIKDLDRSETAVHSKMFIGDDESIISSFNLDYRSERLNLETGELIKSKSFTDHIRSVVEHELTTLPYVKTVAPGDTLAELPGAACITRFMSRLFRKSL